jgi:hypothetical protein
MSTTTPDELQLVERRLSNQRLVRTPLPSPADVVRWLGAVQAQEYPGASWGIAQRAHGMTQDAVNRAYAAGAILRTHVMRPTWHFVHPADIRWLLALTSPRVHALNASLYRKLDLDAGLLARSATAIVAALEGNNHLTRNELAAELERAGILRPTDDRLRLAYMAMHAELEGLICSGRMRGKQHTYALLDERVAPAPTLTRDEALAELVWRYFASHGPASVKDFTWWSGLTTADAKAGLAMNRSRLETVDVNDHSYWFAPGAPARPEQSPVAHLLPAYDEYTVAYKDHSAILDQAYRERVVAAFGIVIVVDGRIAGSWKRVLGTSRVRLTLAVFGEPSDAERAAIARATERYGAFLERPVELLGAES